MPAQMHADIKAKGEYTKYWDIQKFMDIFERHFTLFVKLII